MATALRKVVESSPAATPEPVRVAAQAVQTGRLPRGRQ